MWQRGDDDSGLAGFDSGASKHETASDSSRDEAGAVARDVEFKEEAGASSGTSHVTAQQPAAQVPKRSGSAAASPDDAVDIGVEEGIDDASPVVSVDDVADSRDAQPPAPSARAPRLYSDEPAADPAKFLSLTSSASGQVLRAHLRAMRPFAALAHKERAALESMAALRDRIKVRLFFTPREQQMLRLQGPALAGAVARIPQDIATFKEQLLAFCARLDHSLLAHSFKTRVQSAIEQRPEETSALVALMLEALQTHHDALGNERLGTQKQKKLTRLIDLLGQAQAVLQQLCENQQAAERLHAQWKDEDDGDDNGFVISRYTVGFYASDFERLEDELMTQGTSMRLQSDDDAAQADAHKADHWYETDFELQQGIKKTQVPSTGVRYRSRLHPGKEIRRAGDHTWGFDNDFCTDDAGKSVFAQFVKTLLVNYPAERFKHVDFRFQPGNKEQEASVKAQAKIFKAELLAVYPEYNLSGIRINGQSAFIANKGAKNRAYDEGDDVFARADDAESLERFKAGNISQTAQHARQNFARQARLFQHVINENQRTRPAQSSNMHAAASETYRAPSMTKADSDQTFRSESLALKTSV